MLPLTPEDQVKILPTLPLNPSKTLYVEFTESELDLRSCGLMTNDIPESTEEATEEHYPGAVWGSFTKLDSFLPQR